MKDNIYENIDDYFRIYVSGEIYVSAIGRLEKELIEKALERSYGNQIRAAKILGINRNTLRTKIRKLGIDVERFRR